LSYRPPHKGFHWFDEALFNLLFTKLSHIFAVRERENETFYSHIFTTFHVDVRNTACVCDAFLWKKAAFILPAPEQQKYSKLLRGKR
jgi:hypothetical protein